MNYPFHINPETNRANKCYNPEKCRFGLPASEHYATAAEAIAVRDARIAEKQLAEASQQYYRAHDARLNELLNQNQNHRERLAETLEEMVQITGVEVNDNMSPRQVLKALESSDRSEKIPEGQLDSVRTTLRDINRDSRSIRKLDSIYTNWHRYFESEDGTVHADNAHMAPPRGWRSEIDRTWLTNLSGKDPSDVVKIVGPSLCSDCFTSEPETNTKKAASTTSSKKSKTRCKGSGTEHYDQDTADLGEGSSKTAVCNDCGQRITVNMNGNLRTHRKENVRTRALQKGKAKELATAS